MTQSQECSAQPPAGAGARAASGGTGATFTGMCRDIGGFILARPGIRTLVKPATRAEREDLSQRIQQRLGIDVTTYSILNVHRIGIAVPGQEIFARLMTWGPDSPYWPNHLARVTRVDEGLENIEIRLFGWRRFLGFRVKPLFCLNSVRIQPQPGAAEHDNARYLLFTCSGGYPIGYFTMYVRSSIASMNEKEPSQLFLAVGFNVYGRRRLARTGPARLVTALWEVLHNRVTNHVLERLKDLCEKEFGEVEAGRRSN